MRPWNKERRQYRARAELPKAPSPSLQEQQQQRQGREGGARAGEERGQEGRHEAPEVQSADGSFVTEFRFDTGEADEDYRLPPIVPPELHTAAVSPRRNGRATESEVVASTGWRDGVPTAAPAPPVEGHGNLSRAPPGPELETAMVAVGSPVRTSQQAIVLKPMRMQPSPGGGLPPPRVSGETTPAVLYKNQFTLRPSAYQDSMEMSAYVKEYPQPDLSQAPVREWQRLRLRMPGGIRERDALLINETAALIVGKDAKLVRETVRGALLEVRATDRPTSRLQAELLANWYEAQKSKLVARGKERRPLLLDPDAGQPRRGSDHALEYDSSARLGDMEMMDKLMDNWGLMPEPFLFLDLLEVDVDGAKLPNDLRFHRALTQTNALAAAAAIHQVAMHCHERGALLANVWNTQLALTDLEHRQLRMQREEQAAEQERLEAALEAVRSKALQIDAMEAEVREARAAEQKAKEEANMFMLRTRKEREELKAIKLRGGSKTEMEEAKEELTYLRAELLETERQRDVSLTALYTSMDVSRQAAKQVLQLRDSEEQRGRRTKAEEGDDSSCAENASKLLSIQNMLDKAINLEESVEAQLTRGTASKGNVAATAEFSSVLDAARNAGKKMSSLIRTNTDGSAREPEVERGESVTAGDHESDGGGISLGGSDAEVGSGGEHDDAVSVRSGASLRSGKSVKFGRGLTGDGEDEGRGATAEERRRVAENAATLGIELSMDDVLEMKRDEMVAEIKDLRSREHYMLQTLKSFRIKEERINAGIADLEDTSNLTPNKSKMVVSMLRAVVASKERELQRKHEQETARLRQRVKKQGQAKARETRAEREAWEREQENKQAEWLMAIAMMRMQYKALWDLYMASSDKPEGPENEGLPPPPEFGQFFLKFLDQRLEGSAAAAKVEETSSRGSDGGGQSRHTDAVARGTPQQGSFRRARESSGDGGTARGKSSGARSVRNMLKQARQMRHMGHLTEFSRRFSMKRLGEDGGEEEKGPPKLKDGWASGSGRGWGVPNRSSGREAPRKASEVVCSGPSMLNLHGNNAASAARAAAIKKARFVCKDTTLREALYKFQDTPPRSIEWAIKIIEAIYKTAQSQEAKGKKDAPESMPSLLMSHFTSQYGARNLVQEYASAMVATLRKYGKENIRLEVFSNFLSEDWDFRVLSTFLEAMRMVETRGSVAVTCVEYPPDRDRRQNNPFVCTRKAVAIAEVVLGKRHPECAAGFAVQLMKSAVAATSEEISMYLTSPNPLDDASIEREEVSGGVFRKIKMFDFLKAVAKEANRLQTAIVDAVPQLFRQWDTDSDGMMRREDLLGMHSAILTASGSETTEEPGADAQELWHSCLRIETTEAESSGNEPPEDAIGLNAFREACIRNQLVRDHLRMAHALPPPPELDEEQEERQGKVLYLIADRNWKDFSGVVERILANESEGLGPDESLLKGMINKLDSRETDGRAKARLLVAIVKLLTDVQIGRMKALTEPDPAQSFKFEGFLERAQRAVRVMYGWGALLEDEDELFERMLDPAMPLIQRSKAVRQWNASAKLFAAYKRKIEAHAANLLKIQFASLWLAHNKGAPQNLKGRYKVNYTSVGLAASVLKADYGDSGAPTSRSSAGEPTGEE